MLRIHDGQHAARGWSVAYSDRGREIRAAAACHSYGSAGFARTAEIAAMEIV